MTTCPLCQGSTDLRLVETIDGDEVNRGWERDLGLPGPLEARRLHYIECASCLLRFFDPMEAGGPDLYASLQAFDWYYLSHKPEFELALRHLEDAESVLEVGAGAGAFSSQLGERRYVGLETNDQAVAAARTAGIDLLHNTIGGHAAEGHRYDAVVAFQVLEHVPDPRAFLRTCVECLTPGGRLVVAVPTLDGFVGSAVNNWLNMPPHHVTHWSTATFTAAAKRLGLDLVTVDIEPVAPFHESWAVEVVRAKRLRTLLGLRHQLVDRRARARLTAKLARAWPGSRAQHLGPHVRGHTCVAVLRRPEHEPPARRQHAVQAGPG